MIKILENTSLFLILATVLGLLLPEQAKSIQFLAIWTLVIMMTLSLRSLKLREIRLSENIRPAVASLFLNYFALSGLIILLGYFFANHPMYFNGFIIAALMPPAVVIIAYNMLLRGNQEAALIAEVIAYILSLCIIPVTVLLLFGQTVDIAYLAWLIFIMIGLPIIVSRFLHFKCTAFNYCKIAINICMFLLFFILVGINQATILNGELIVFWLIIAGLLKTYLIPAIIFLAMKCPPFKRKEKITYALFGSVKNLGTGAVIALSLFGPEAALVSVILMLTEIPFYIVIGRLKTADICQA